MPTPKALLRRDLLQQRLAMPIDLYQQHSRAICQHLQTFLTGHPGQTVLTYYPHRQEPDVSSLWADTNYCWGLPRCLPRGQMAWHSWQPGEPLIKNVYGIAEPSMAADLIDLQEEIILLIPAVGLDSNGYRLGYGGGYFDRFLATRSQLITVGVAFELAVVPQLPIDKWDLPLWGICTESGMVVDLTSRAL
jgi:5-formyltetrahydrofolate cyclo-ligase